MLSAHIFTNMNSAIPEQN